jgi:ketosteroid isomerase-like protein
MRHAAIARSPLEQTTMTTTRRTVLAAAGIGLASLERAAADEPHLAGLVRSSAEGNAALMRGDIRTYLEQVPLADDFLLMSPFGGPPSLDVPYTPERLESIGRFFRNGSFDQQVVRSWASADMAVLATVERANVEVGGLPAQDWALRVTLVYRRDGSQWRLVHRHADPLANGVTVEQAAAISRGDVTIRPRA